MTNEEYQRLADRVAELEALATHCSNPEDREIDNALRRALKTAISVAWLVKNLTIFAGIIIGGKLALDQLMGWFR